MVQVGKRNGDGLLNLVDVGVLVVPIVDHRRDLTVESESE